MSSTDVVFIDSLHLAVDVGPDWWGKARPQPVQVSVYLHLQPSFLNTSGSSDNVLDSIHYGHLSKAVSSSISGSSFTGVEKLVSAVNKEAFTLAGAAAAEVRVVVNLPKQILLADGFSVDTVTSLSDALESTRTVSIKDLVLPVLIGVNPPEREAKQRVITNITFHERPSSSLDQRPLPDYPAVVAAIVKDIEASSYLTLEAFVMQIVRSGCLASDNIDRVTVRSQKPSAVSFAHSSGVEITRRRAELL
ncbi:hypothetical protein C0991_012165 [Blastosporella zonata]|nr:hypothetical protein C0991_012165 [Blastosporella zonata]